ncbi:sigma 54-interacting transcriptional regulator [Martelella alba]|uniref:AAA family ATPase n=1 Tax=Martelella alba TaxID=2590451 RepID=A0ABY2SSN6_9HYPH|nr:sigma 54-interacting transcriptional regulator [Martelella alba]TKI07232.1 AAA family ATPase [Martelella alba]
MAIDASPPATGGQNQVMVPRPKGRTRRCPAGGDRPRQGPFRHEVDKIITCSPAMKAVMAAVARVAPTCSTVVLRGEPGTGKDVIARAIHQMSPRAAGPFVKLCCDYQDPAEVLLALFGSEAGFATPGGPYAGQIARAEGGTLFISEIGGFSLALQKRLFHFLQEQMYQPLGGGESLPADVRIICATEKNLEKMMVQGELLAELYYRIHIATVSLPPLRERKEDIPALAAYFYERYNRVNGTCLTIDEAALAPLYCCRWPGNVRDFENCLEHAALQAVNDAVRQLPCLTGRCFRQRLNQRILDQQTMPAAANEAGAPFVSAAAWPPMPAPDRRAAGRAEAFIAGDDARRRLIGALKKSGGVKAKAARLLNITPRQLYYALKKLDIQVDKF